LDEHRVCCRSFSAGVILPLPHKGANAHREGGEMVRDAERAAIEEISASLARAVR